MTFFDSSAPQAESRGCTRTYSEYVNAPRGSCLGAVAPEEAAPDCIADSEGAITHLVEPACMGV